MEEDDELYGDSKIDEWFLEEDFEWITEDNLNLYLDDLNCTFIRMDRYRRDMEVLLMEDEYRKELDQAVVTMCSMMLEFRDTLDSIHNLFYYLKECKDRDQVNIMKLADKCKLDLYEEET